MKTIVTLALTLGLNSFALAIPGQIKSADCKKNTSAKTEAKCEITLKKDSLRKVAGKGSGCDVPELCYKKDRKKN